MATATYAQINTEALAHNLGRVREYAPGAKVMAIVKADGYGHGLATSVSALSSADAFGVATIDEALQIRRLGYAGRIAVLSRIQSLADMRAVLEAHLWPVLHDAAQIELLRQALADAQGSAPPRVWLKVDTGMHRLGLRPEEFDDAAQTLGDLVRRIDLMTHFASADDPGSPATPDQIDAFNSVSVERGARRSAANSAGVVAWPASHYDWVRPGVMLYGCSPLLGETADTFGLKPAMTLHSSLIAVRTHKASEAAGYAGTWVSERDTRLGVVACGYADGYPRHAPNGTPVIVNGERVSVAGRVSMDTLIVDLGPGSTAAVGDPVVLWGEGLPVEEIATASGTIGYELMCRVSGRVPRQAM